MNPASENKICLLCEYMIHPVGLDLPHPLFTWSLEEPGAKVTAFRLYLDDDPGRLQPEKALWDTGWIRQEAFRFRYDGPALRSGVTYHWGLDLAYTLEGTRMQLSSGAASFTTGLLGDPWTAPWIGGLKIDQKSYLYRKEWSQTGEIRHAAAFVASPCYYVLTVNGQKADDTVLNNVFADYEKSLYYRTYDITGLVRQEKNALGIMTGLGWHSLREAEDGIGWGDSLFSLMLRLEYSDGSVCWLTSGLEGWTYSTDGPVRYNSIYNGETYDARMEMPGWDTFGFEDASFSPVVEREAPGGVLRSQMLEPIRRVRELPVQKILPVGDGSYTLDFGKNFAGWVRMTLSGRRGQTITIQPAEMIHPDGSVNPVSLRNAHPLDTYILKGEGTEIYEPRFTFHGFRYAQIFGLEKAPDQEAFTGCFIRTDAERIGSFSCSDEIVNRFYDMVCQTEECNIHGVPTDCPQRDERLGWLNDMTVRNEGALYNYRHYQLYAKWLRDIRDTQGKTTGAITDTAPFMRYGFRPADPVSGSFLQLPWNLYLWYGDDRLIRENYEANARWVDYLRRNSTDLIVNFSSMGDWAAPIGGTDLSSTGGGALSTITPQRLMSTGYFYHDCTLMERMARVLQREKDACMYRELAEKVLSAFNRTYYDPIKKIYAAGSQASQVLPLYFRMVPKGDEEAVLAHLLEDIVCVHDTHLTTGNICTRHAIEVLFEYGQADLAWKLLSQTTYPSWGYMIQNGATTVWERWEKVEDNPVLAAMASLNHPMNGGAAVALPKYLAGIRPDPEKPGCENFLLQPILPKDAKQVSVQIRTLRGRILSRWHREGGEVLWEVRIPCGCTADLLLPGDPPQKTKQIGSGTFFFRFKAPA